MIIAYIEAALMIVILVTYSLYSVYLHTEKRNKNIRMD